MSTTSPAADPVVSSVTPEQVAFFHENGFLALDPITTEDELSWMRASYDRIFAERAGREEGNQFDLGGADEEGMEARLPQILNPAKYAPELRDGVYLKHAEAICKQLLGPEATGGPGHAIFKPAGVGAETPWHQDEAYWDPSKEYTSVSVWMPLQEATIEMAACGSCLAATAGRSSSTAASAATRACTGWRHRAWTRRGRWRARSSRAA
jgi:ectoine hydroxylase-related dioxygenase (phytanoyl-CoA dioxygenase family)